MTGTHEPILVAQNLTKIYGGLTALAGISLELYPGEVLALVGDNGAGKSTLLGILSGNITPTSGHLMIDGEVRHLRRPADATAAGIATVYQDLALALDLDVADNLFLGRELSPRQGPGRWVRWLDRRRMMSEARAALDDIHIRIPDLRSECRKLSGGQRQAIAIARAVTWCKRALLLDEPTAALGVEQQREVLALIDKVRAKGIATILVSHQLPHVLEIADRIAVLRRGRLAGVLDRSEASTERLIALITGLETAA
ncbi:ATP-binding cassette domain-containing protein [Amycolatopsis sp. DSM 110486]|uniref:ATP-binding cassette domain-containing protein n=1 Tax=Amycolatopsis sp. DSM 110486 TaxID=2865832 RepID=UPI001C69AA1B|nr:ATP-binding cassette domain-containing protein [Amycolatopsis sp. DSM 110486]QYN18802.1 ATP-binding cassette domain-containing protein [Amycolatopsis sp. DSM 110486]